MKVLSNPLVSVIIPSFNPGKYIEYAIQSVEKQTYKNFEIIVVDDGSTDGTVEWIKNQKGRIRYSLQENSGAAIARNNGVKIARGDYIAFLDADDLWSPKKLEKQLCIFKRFPEVSFVFSNGYKVYGDNSYNYIMTSKYETKDSLFEQYTDPPELIDFAWNFKINSVPTSSVVIKKELFDIVGGFPNLRRGQDFALWQLLLEKGKAFAIKDKLMFYRAHSTNNSSSLKQTTFNKRMEKIKNKDSARMILKPILTNKDKLPFQIKLYYISPPILRLTMLLCWRFYFGANSKKVLKDIGRYLRGKEAY